MELRQSQALRERMVLEQIQARGIEDPVVFRALQKVPREEFVLPALRFHAYEDRPLPIEENQTISQPYIVALMAEALQLKPKDKVLEIGTGSGYAAAVLSLIVSHVYTIEYFPRLAEDAEKKFRELGYPNISIRQGDGNWGWAENAPYQGISVTASGTIPQPLLEQLVIGGRLVMPVKQEDESQELMLITRKGEKDFTYVNLGAVRFVPLLGSSTKGGVL